MSDISKCNGVNCPIKDKCYRYTAPDGYWQSWGAFVYDDGCDDFWQNELK